MRAPTSCGIDSCRYTTIAKELLGTVQTIADLADQAKFQSPTVIVVGEVVRLGRELHWFSEAVVEYRVGFKKARENTAELGV